MDFAKLPSSLVALPNLLLGLGGGAMSSRRTGFTMNQDRGFYVKSLSIGLEWTLPSSTSAKVFNRAFVISLDLILHLAES